MDKKKYYIVNAITLYRLSAAPVLILLVVLSRPLPFTILLIISFFSDAIDGYLARRTKTTSVFGSRIDSIADDLTIAAAIAGIAVYKPDFVQLEKTAIIQLAVLFALQTILSLVRYGKMSSFHTYAAKTAAILQGIFIILLFLLPAPLFPLFDLMYAVTTLELAEEIALVLVLPKWQPNVKGLYWVYKEKRTTNHL